MIMKRKGKAKDKSQGLGLQQVVSQERIAPHILREREREHSVFIVIIFISFQYYLA
jgi:hypothetical protein